MKKALSFVNTALLSLMIAGPAYAQNIGVGKPAEAKITDIGRLVQTGISAAIIISGILVFVFLVWGGIEWLTSGGDKTKTENAKNRITAALVGLAIIASSWALVRIIAYFFGVEGGLDGSVNIPRPYGN